MFGKSGNIYTVHEKLDVKEPTDRVLLVREGFSFWAFVFTILWLLMHRCWIVGVIYLALAIIIEQGGSALGLGTYTIAAMQLGLQIWVGCVAHDAQRAALARRGYREIDVVCGESLALAERRYFDRHPLHSA